MAYVKNRTCGINCSMSAPRSGSLHLANSSSRDQIAQLSQTVVDLMNARDFSNPWFRQHVSENVRVDFQGDVSFGLDGFLGNYIVGINGSPDFRVAIGNITVLVDENQGTGTALLSQYLSRFQSHARRMAGTLLFSWTRIRHGAHERWICQSATMMMGTPIFLTDDIYGTI